MPPNTFPRREAGLERTGQVYLRDFDEGVKITLRPILDNQVYYLDVPGVNGPPGKPGVPLIFANPEEILTKKHIPSVSIQRDSIAPTMNRWHGTDQLQYRTAALGALTKSVTTPGGVVVTGVDSTEQLTQAIPHDIGYTITIYASTRDGQASHAQAILRYVQRIYQPYSVVYVKDSVGDFRTYSAYMEGVAILDTVAEVGERHIGFALTLRVEAELDLNDPKDSPTVFVSPIKRFSLI